MVEAAVMGAGAWGTALAKVLADAGNGVRLWTRRPELATEINTTHRNPDYLGDTALPAGIRATGDAAEALEFLEGRLADKALQKQAEMGGDYGIRRCISETVKKLKRVK